MTLYVCSMILYDLVSYVIRYCMCYCNDKRLLGVGLFTVPMGLFASAFRERASAASFNSGPTRGLDEMHAKKLRRRVEA